MEEPQISYVTLPVVMYNGKPHLLGRDGSVLRNSRLDLSSVTGDLNTREIEGYAVRGSVWGQWSTRVHGNMKARIGAHKRKSCDVWLKWYDSAAHSTNQRYRNTGTGRPKTLPLTWEETYKAMVQFLCYRRSRARTGKWGRWSETAAGNHNKRVRRQSHGKQR